jgi:acyl-CoA thioesterase-1
MNPVVLYFASGESLYPGAATLLVAIAVSPLLERRWLLRLRNVSAWLALIMIVMACPPFSWSVDVVFLSAFLFWYSVVNLSPLRKARGLTSAILATLLIILPGLELQHRSLPQVTGAPTDHLVVIGDSISAGIDPRVSTWPAVIEETFGVPVKNLSSVGAFTTDGLRMAPKVAPEDRVILIEIGGNDLIAGAPSNEFASSLEALLKEVTAPGRTVVMFELPLMPDRIAYGQVQRRLAEKYGVWLIPKRYFVSVISGANATSDGLHLLPEGARRMAALVAQVLAPVLKPARPAA